MQSAVIIYPPSLQFAQPRKDSLHTFTVLGVSKKNTHTHNICKIVMQWSDFAAEITYVTVLQKKCLLVKRIKLITLWNIYLEGL